MKVLKNNFDKLDNGKEVVKIKPYPRRLTCEWCKSELEYEKSDLTIGEYGIAHLKCPLCHCINQIDDHEDNITLTSDNIEFPTHFHHTSTETGAVDCCDNAMVKEYIKKAINYLRINKDESNYGGHITGNFYINVDRCDCDECYEITVSNDFYTTCIQFEAADY